jgi:elongation factor 1-gamma
VLDGPEGPIFESNAIMRFFARKAGLVGANAYENALVDQWIDFSIGELEANLGKWIYPIVGYAKFDAEVTEAAKKNVARALEAMNTVLTHQTFLVGESITAADIACAMALFNGYRMVLDNKFRKPFGAVNRWYTTCVRQPKWAAILGGRAALVKEMMVAKPAPVEEKKPEPKKEEKKPAAEDDGEEEPKEAKKPNPLDLLPPSKLNLDEWKRYYSNAEDTRGDACKWFFEKIDDGWSVWFSEYKYPADLTKMLNTTNLVGGYIQRLDRLRKYGFASLVIFGDEEQGMQIGGCFMVRGQTMPAELTEVDDCELYDWRKADLTNAADKELIEDYFCWEGKFGGKFKPVASGKIFK